MSFPDAPINPPDIGESCCDGCGVVFDNAHSLIEQPCEEYLVDHYDPAWCVTCCAESETACENCTATYEAVIEAQRARYRKKIPTLQPAHPAAVSGPPAEGASPHPHHTAPSAVPTLPRAQDVA